MDFKLELVLIPVADVDRAVSEHAEPGGVIWTIRNSSFGRVVQEARRG